jgi:soluble lytic murein transglycosylase
MKNKKKLFTGILCVILAACAAGPVPVSPTDTSSPTLPPSVTPSITLTPTLTPSPTPTPEVRLKTGDLALFNGDYLRAQTEYQAALSTSTDSEMRAAALWGLGRVEYAAGNYGKARDDLSNLANNYPGSSNAARAHFIMGEIYTSLERYTEAAQAYTDYLSLRPGVLDAFTQERRADAYNAAGNYHEAILGYNAALAAPHISSDTTLQIKIAQAYVNLGDSTTAFSIYDSILQGSSNDYVKAQMDFLTGQLYLSLGQTDQAYQFFLDTVDKYPLAYDSYSALVALVDANVPVDDMSRGLVDYFASQFGYAVEAFQRYIDANPQNDGTAVYYQALAYYGLGQYEKAVQLWDVFIQNHPDNPHWAAAWNGNSALPGRAYTQWYWLNQNDIAAQTLLTFIKLAPNDAKAPIYLMETARILERGGKLDEAAGTWERVADEYPNNDLVPQALFWAGITRFRNAEFDQALVTFQRGLQFSTIIEDQTRAFFWIGKAQQKLGDESSAQTSWQHAASLDPTDYYSLRSQDMLRKRPAFEPSPAVKLSADLTSERKQAESWLRVTFNLPTDTELSEPGALLSDPRLVRGTELWNLGLEDEARQEFEDLRTSTDQNPADSYRLANYLLELGLYRPAITALRQVLTLAGMNTQSQTLATPAYFNHIRYGLYYQDLVVPAAQQAGFDPLFLFSVIRQESLFEGFVRSAAGARGLMQITPDTGQFVSDNLGWPPNYTADDLYRPMVSITLGATYLAQQRLRFNDDLFTALAAYNGGPSAAPIWRDLSGLDSDLFVEVIRFEETRTYIRSIYEIYSMYRSIYGSVP